MEIQVCTRCVMDSSDPLISFNDKGVCNHCRKFDNILSPLWDKNGLNKLKEEVKKIKSKQKNKKYDCIIGLSGGVDSSYLLHFAVKELGLRVLALHIDGGWNSLPAVNNIENLVNKLNVDLETIVINWQEMKDLQVSFLKAGVANCDAPQDHAFFSGLYKFASKKNIKYILNGSNIATESVLPFSWGHFAMDGIHLRNIHKKYGKLKLKTFPITGFFKYYFYYPYFSKIKVIKPLNFINYNKDDAIKLLENEYEWQSYGRKHGESIWTKFFQNYYLPEKFGFDKRKAHLSSLILSGEITREKALLELDKPLYENNELEEDINYILNKLELDRDEWAIIRNTPIKSYKDYDNNEDLYQLKKKYIDPIIKKMGF